MFVGVFRDLWDGGFSGFVGVVGDLRNFNGFVGICRSFMGFYEF